VPEIIAPSQSAFVPGKLITNNILLAYEMTHHMRNKGCRKHGLAAFKLDMSKAYDRVEWSFLEGVMRKMGFNERWISLIMICVTTVNYKIKVNGELTETIVPRRGLRQGDPLSPYLFILCAKGLSVLLEDAENKGLIEGVKICRAAPRVSHLFFADDSLIFVKASVSGAHHLQQILSLYESVSGQMINKDKTAAMFSKNAPAHVKEQIMASSGSTRRHEMTNIWGYQFISENQRNQHLHISNKEYGLESKDGMRSYSPRQGRRSLSKRYHKPFLPLLCHVLT
jgi:hypothetical protein